MTESAPLDPRNAYAATKVHGEQLATIWSRETGGGVAALRFHNVYGPGMPRNTPYAGVASIFTDSLRRGEPPRVFEDGCQRRNFIHVSDVAAAVVAAVEAPLPAELTPLNIGTPWVTTVGEMATELSRMLGGPPPDRDRRLSTRRRAAHHCRQFGGRTRPAAGELGSISALASPTCSRCQGTRTSLPRTWPSWLIWCASAARSKGKV